MTDCPAYEIEGTIEPGESGSMASVYVHTGSEPVVGQEVFATFTDPDGQSIGEPTMLITATDGRATLPVPPEATGVSFVAESSDDQSCTVPSGAEPSVALEIGALIDAPEGSESTVTGDAPGQLAHTGPVSPGVVAAAVLLGALGCGVWMGRGRRVHGGDGGIHW